MRLRLVLLAAVVIVPALLALLLLRSGARDDLTPVEPPARGETRREGFTGALDLWLGGALDPGPLSTAHASLAGVGGCLDCHGSASQVIDARCVACHEEIGARAERKIGLHGTFDEPCHTCHTEHDGADTELIVLDRDAFQHKLSRFPLHGGHVGAKCEACHLALPLAGGADEVFHYQGVPSASCTGCHVDPHAGGAREDESLGTIRQVALDAPAFPPAVRSPENPIAGRDCATCHRESGWRAAQLRRGRFDHEADTLFALRGAHVSVACDGCHTEKLRKAERKGGEAPGRGADPDCATCHEDPHQGEMRAADGCRTCHSESGWHKGFDHDRDTRFALDDLHARLECGACHSDQRFRAEGRECKSCHRDADLLLAGRFADSVAEPDVHGDAITCGDCHGPTRVDNRPTALAQRCVECHTPEYAGLLTTWRSKLDELAGRTSLEPAEAERLRHGGSHNFALAHKLLRDSAR